MKTKINQEERAYKAWKVLAHYAKEERYLTYKELGDSIFIHHRAVRFVLGRIQEYCKKNQLPPLTILVVNKDTGKPGEGFIAWDIENIEDGVKKVRTYDWIQYANPFAYAANGENLDDLAEELIHNPKSSKDVYSRVKVRGVAQKLFRQTLLRIYDYSCCICDLSFEEVLEAGHIIPYSESNSAQRLDICNGLLLCANHHKMFDAGLISIDDDYSIKFNDWEMNDGFYTDADKQVSVNYHGKKLQLPKGQKYWPNLEYLKIHQKKE